MEPTGTLPTGVLRIERLSYRGKHYQVPVFDPAEPLILRPEPARSTVPIPADEPVLRTLNSTWDLAQFRVPRRPVSLETPVKLTSRQKELLREFEAINQQDPDAHSPRAKNWFDKVREFFGP